MPYRAAALLGYLGFEVSSRMSFMRLSYDISTVISLSRRIAYGGDVCSSDIINYCYEVSLHGDAAVLNICDIWMGIFLMVPRVGISLC